MLSKNEQIKSKDSERKKNKCKEMKQERAKAESNGEIISRLFSDVLQSNTSKN